MEDSSSSKDLNYLPRFQKGKKKKKETNKQKSQMKTNKQTKTQNQPIKKKKQISEETRAIQTRVLHIATEMLLLFPSKTRDLVGCEGEFHSS